MVALLGVLCSLTCVAQSCPVPSRLSRTQKKETCLAMLATRYYLTGRQISIDLKKIPIGLKD